jgi:hypothetical protein
MLKVENYPGEMPGRTPNVQGSDTTGADSSNAAEFKKTIGL